MEPGLCTSCSQSQTILTSYLWTRTNTPQRRRTFANCFTLKPHNNCYIHKCVIHVRDNVNKCYIHLYNMHMLQGVTCLAVCPCMLGHSTQRIQPRRWCGPKTHKDQGDTRDKFWQKRPGRCFTHAIWLAVLHVPVHFNWLCYISWTQNGAPFVTDT